MHIVHPVEREALDAASPGSGFLIAGLLLGALAVPVGIWAAWGGFTSQAEPCIRPLGGVIVIASMCTPVVPVVVAAGALALLSVWCLIVACMRWLRGVTGQRSITTAHRR
jgi:hypothetical protein